MVLRPLVHPADRSMQEVRCTTPTLGDRRCGRLLAPVAIPFDLRMTGQVDIELHCPRCKKHFSLQIAMRGELSLIPLD